MADLSFEWTMLLLRVVFIFLLYFFVFQVIRVTTRELRAAAEPRPAYAAGPEAPPGAIVVVTPGEAALDVGAIIELEPVSVLGRHRDATVFIPSRHVSSQHAQLSWDEGHWWIVDLGSTNGTLLNGQPVTRPMQLQSGDQLELAGTVLELSI